MKSCFRSIGEKQFHEHMNQRIPEYLYEKGNITRLIFFTALFALVFINIYQPFGAQNWFPVSEIMFFLFSSMIILTGVLVVVVSRILMIRHGRKKGLLMWQYALWILAEIVAMAMFYTLFERMILHDLRSFREMFRQSFINTSLVLLLPYSILWLYFALRDKVKKLEILNSGKTEPGIPLNQMLNFTDEKKELRLSVRHDQVFWIESADNYIRVFYLNKGKMAAFMIRNTLKTIENKFVHTSLVRCSRSAIVNFDKVKVLRKEQNGIFLVLDHEEVPDIPVSKTYASRVLARFSESA
jgi:hypothetical protein